MKQLNQLSLQSVYGDPSAALEARTLRTLAALPEGSGVKKRQGKRRIVILALVSGILALGTALAITLRSGLSQRFRLPEAAEALVQMPDPAVSSAVTDMAVFTVDSYLFDGVSLMADVRVDPSRSGIWILPETYERFLDDPASNIGVDGTDLSIRACAASMGIRQIRYVQITGEISDGDISSLWIQSEPCLGSDGHIHLLITASMPGTSRPETDLILRFYVLFGAQPREDTVTLHLAAGAEADPQHIPLEMEVLGVTIRHFELIRTPAVVYYRITYTCVPETGCRVSALPVSWDSEDQQIMKYLWQGGHYSSDTRTGIFLGVLPSSAEKDGRFTFRLLVNGQRSEPITVALPSPKQ